MFETLLVHGLKRSPDDCPVLNEIKIVESVLFAGSGLLHLQHHRQPTPLMVRIISQERLPLHPYRAIHFGSVHISSLIQPYLLHDYLNVLHESLLNVLDPFREECFGDSLCNDLRRGEELTLRKEEKV